MKSEGISWGNNSSPTSTMAISGHWAARRAIYRPTVKYSRDIAKCFRAMRPVRQHGVRLCKNATRPRIPLRRSGVCILTRPSSITGAKGVYKRRGSFSQSYTSKNGASTPTDIISPQRARWKLLKRLEVHIAQLHLWLFLALRQGAAPFIDPSLNIVYARITLR